MTFRRLTRPYMLAAFALTGFNLYANHWLIPNANKSRIAFMDTYIDMPYQTQSDNILLQVDKNVNAYVSNYSYADSTAYKFGLDRFDDNGNLLSKLRADRLVWNARKGMWQAFQYVLRVNHKMDETIIHGRDTLLKINLAPKDFNKKITKTETLNAAEMNEVIRDLSVKGAEQVVYFKIEKYKRTAFPFAIPILTLIAVSLASRRLRGGMGLHIALGFVIGFSYIWFMQLSSTFSSNANLPALVGAWIPNAIFGVVALLLYRSAPK